MKWSVFAVRPDGTWWRLYDSRAYDAPTMTRQWAEETAQYLNDFYGGWKNGAARYEPRPYDWNRDRS
jgi:hypothetical protein